MLGNGATAHLCPVLPLSPRRNFSHPFSIEQSGLEQRVPIRFIKILPLF
jgi:hypothetical protein